MPYAYDKLRDNNCDFIYGEFQKNIESNLMIFGTIKTVFIVD